MDNPARPVPATRDADDVVHGPVPGYERSRAYRDRQDLFGRERERRRTAVRQRALILLAREHPEDFRRLYHGELVEAGLARARDGHGDA